MRWLRKLRGRSMRRAMLRHGAVEKPCPHCGEPTPVYEDGATACLICGGSIGERYPRSARLIGNNKILFEIGDLRPNEHVRVPIRVRVEKAGGDLIRKPSNGTIGRGGPKTGEDK